MRGKTVKLITKGSIKMPWLCTVKKGKKQAKKARRVGKTTRDKQRKASEKIARKKRSER